MSIPIHRFIDPADPSRSISTVDKESPTGEYGRYRRSIRIHLRRIAVNVEKGLGLPISPFSCQSAFRRSRPQLKLGEEIDSSRLVDDYALQKSKTPNPTLKPHSGDFYSPQSDPPHPIMHYCIYYSILLTSSLSCRSASICRPYSRG